MAEYGIRQRSQLSRTISNSKSTVEPQTNFVDNRGNNALFSLIQCRQAPVTDNRLPIQMGKRRGKKRKKSNRTSHGPTATPVPTVAHTPATMPPAAALLSDSGNTTNETSCETTSEKEANTACSIISFIPGLLDTIYGAIDAYNSFKGQEIKYTNIPQGAKLTIDNIYSGRVLNGEQGPNAASVPNKKISYGELHIGLCDTEITSPEHVFGDQITEQQRDISAGVASTFTTIGGLFTIASGISSLLGSSFPTSIMSSIASFGYTMPNIIRLGTYIKESCDAKKDAQISPLCNE